MLVKVFNFGLVLFLSGCMLNVGTVSVTEAPTSSTTTNTETFGNVPPEIFSGSTASTEAFEGALK